MHILAVIEGPEDLSIAAIQLESGFKGLITISDVTGDL